MVAKRYADKSAILVWFRSRQQGKMGSVLPVQHEPYEREVCEHALGVRINRAGSESCSLAWFGVAVLPLKVISYRVRR